MRQETSVPARPKRIWLRVFLGGFLLYLISFILVVLTANPNLFPTLILLGNFLVPVTFVTFLYERQQLSNITLPSLGLSFFLGGVIAVFEAGFLEKLLISGPKFDFFTALQVGLIEELVKLIAVMFVARRIRHNSELDGLLLGAAVGMGFAALESTGYAFTVFLMAFAQGLRPNAPETFPLLVTVAVTGVRSLLSPFGHGVWTATLSAVLFRESRPERFRITIPVFLTYLIVSLLHGLWDGMPIGLVLDIPIINLLPIGYWIVILVGVLMLIRLWKEAIRAARPAL
ncbi:MAG: PrsW family intramembrane metalloprotease [Brasilonema octagenarum HA4186-MV1]|jgi:RsiW-degrading membrane proteinase PrsW (M82 family)|nr:PrsW family intramembrane metalloprotease [Brasilonema octagenarum HA4186-MV1]